MEVCFFTMWQNRIFIILFKNSFIKWEQNHRWTDDTYIKYKHYINFI